MGSMASVGQPLRRDPFTSEHRDFDPSLPKQIPILPSAPSGGGEPMDTSQSQPSSMGPPATTSPNGDRLQEQQHQNRDSQNDSANGGGSHPVGAAAAAQQPKVVQTAFIHKLYKYANHRA